jgi:hypothetical protein
MSCRRWPSRASSIPRRLALALLAVGCAGSEARHSPDGRPAGDAAAEGPAYYQIDAQY